MHNANNTSLTKHEQDLNRIANFRLMDDDFMSEILNDDIEAVTLILRIILRKPDLIITSVKTQYEYRSAIKRSIRMDVRAVDSFGTAYDIEIQRQDQGAAPQRARFHSSKLDADLLAKGEDFRLLKEAFIIFICENDIFHCGYPLYHINRHIEELDNAPFADGSHIIFVNGNFRNLDDPLGQLMHDFHCRESKDMLFPLLANRVHKFKETEGGIQTMCKMLEDMCREAAQEAIETERIQFARRMLQENIPTDMIIRCTELSKEAVEALRDEMLVNA